MNLAKFFENMVARDGVEPPTPAFSAHNQLNSLVRQQLNSSECPIYCDRAVTSADVRLASAPCDPYCLPLTHRSRLVPDAGLMAGLNANSPFSFRLCPRTFATSMHFRFLTSAGCRGRDDHRWPPTDCWYIVSGCRSNNPAYCSLLSHQRRMATPDQTPSTSPNGQAPCKNP
jgi:hypothetical protein